MGRTRKSGVLTLPKSGFKSITIYEGVYDALYDIYIEQSNELRLKGINSFSAFIITELSRILQEKKK